jgi:hypothetical protein
MKLEFPRPIFEKYSNIKFHENWFSLSRVPYGKKSIEINEVSTRRSILQTRLTKMDNLTGEVNCRKQNEFAVVWTRKTNK